MSPIHKTSERRSASTMVESLSLTVIVTGVYFFASQINYKFSLRKTKERLPVVCGGIDFDARNKFLT
jgi:hypothetical protein